MSPIPNSGSSHARLSPLVYCRPVMFGESGDRLHELHRSQTRGDEACHDTYNRVFGCDFAGKDFAGRAGSSPSGETFHSTTDPRFDTLGVTAIVWACDDS